MQHEQRSQRCNHRDRSDFSEYATKGPSNQSGLIDRTNVLPTVCLSLYLSFYSHHSDQSSILSCMSMDNNLFIFFLTMGKSFKNPRLARPGSVEVGTRVLSPAQSAYVVEMKQSSGSPTH